MKLIQRFNRQNILNGTVCQYGKLCFTAIELFFYDLKIYFRQNLEVLKALHEVQCDKNARNVL